MSFYDTIAAELDDLKSIRRERKLRSVVTLGEGRAICNGKEYLNFSGNDYLGIAGNGQLRAEFYRRFRDFADTELGLSAASSRLLTGNHPAYTRLENNLSLLYGNRAALVFNSGYHANIGILPAISGKDDLILSDKLNHASIIDGMQLCQAEFRRYRHLDYVQLEEFLNAAKDKYRQIFIITESVFSMDGDTADLQQLVALKKQYGAVLLVDEAHSVGVRGDNGAGLCAELGLLGDVDFIIGTFGKAFGSAGAYVICDDLAKDFLINKMRSFIFTTGLPPMVINWSNFVLEKQVAMTAERQHLREIGDLLRSMLPATLGDSQIVPYIIGDDGETAKVAERFQSGGILVFPIRPPTVPANSARLRFSLTAALRTEDVRRVGELL